MLRAALAKRRGGFALDVAVEAPAGATLVVVGESGAGKTTLLRLLAGLDRPDTGRIAVGARVYFDAAAGVELPAWEREVGYVAQDYALFPHLTVRDNVAFGLEAGGGSRRAALARADAALERLGVADLARRRLGFASCTYFTAAPNSWAILRAVSRSSLNFCILTWGS